MNNAFNNRIGTAEALAASLFLKNITPSYDIAEIIAFGSRVRGDNTPDSDLDLAVILNGHHKDFIDTKLDMANAAFDVMLETGILVQALPLWKEDLDHPELFPNPSLIANIMHEGVKLS